MGDAAVVMVVDELEKILKESPRTRLKHDIRLSYGSDGAPYRPLLALWCAVIRKGWDGKAADFVVLGEDILHVDPDRIPQIPIERTIVAGTEIVTRRPAAATSSSGGMR